MKRSSPAGVTEMPGFGSSASNLSAADIAKMRRETAQ
jgi:hypothetical protein